MLRNQSSARHKVRRRVTRAVLVVGAAGACAVSIAASTGTPAAADTSAFTPYTVPVTNALLPAQGTSPSIDPAAPYTPVVVSLIAQLEGGNPNGTGASAPTVAELADAGTLLHDGSNPSCHNVGPVAGPTSPTPDGVTLNPSVLPICWTDAQGVNVTSGPNVRNTTGPMDLMGLGSTFDRQVGNWWGQTEGVESRSLMVTGLFGPQTDLDRLPNWGRNLTTTGEDPFLSYNMVAAQINGMQSVGAWSEMKHFAVYNGQSQNTNTLITDQPLHELYFTPYEGGFLAGKAAATMCSYQIWQDTNGPTNTVNTLAPGASPYGAGTQTWPLNESHFSCEQPLSLTYTLRDLWGFVGLVGSDYPATHSTSGIMQGEDQEMPTATGFFSATTNAQGTDPTGSTCADATGKAESCSVAGAVHVGGIPQNGTVVGCQGTSNGLATGTPTTGTVANAAGGCSLVGAVANGSLPISVMNQSLARILYQEQRFGMLGCPDGNGKPTAACVNPGGNGSSLSVPVIGNANTNPETLYLNTPNATAIFSQGDRVIICDSATNGGNAQSCGSNAEVSTIATTGGVDGNQITLTTDLHNNHALNSAVIDVSGLAPLPTGPASGANAAANLGTKNGDAPVVERESEEGGVLLKNDSSTLPITSSDLTSGGILVTGPGAEYTVSDPTSEASIGYLDRDQVNTITQLKNYAGSLYGAGAANGITYAPANSPSGFPVPASALSTSNTSVTGTVNQSINGAPNTSVAGPLDFTQVSSAGQLAAGNYAWSGYPCVYVPNTDNYTFDIEQSAAVPTGNVTFTFDGVTRTLTNPAAIAVPTSPTNAGYTEAGLTLRQFVYPSNATTLFSASAANATNIKVASVTGMLAGEIMAIDDGASAETSTNASVGTAGDRTLGRGQRGRRDQHQGRERHQPDGGRSDRAQRRRNQRWRPPRRSRAGGVEVPAGDDRRLWAWTLNVGMTYAHASGEAVSDQGTGVTLTSGLASAHAAGAAVAIAPLQGGTYHSVSITFNNSTGAPASFRFGYNRAAGDIADAVAAAAGKKLAVVFLNDVGASSTTPNPYGSGTISAPQQMSASNTNLVTALAATGVPTAVVINSTNPVLMPWVGSVKSVMEMWYASQEGGTSQARLLLGLADTSCHLSISFPGQPHRHDLGLQRDPPVAGQPAGHVGSASGASERRPGWHHQRDRGHLHGLSLPGRGGHHASVSVRVGSVLHDVLVLQPGGRARQRRWRDGAVRRQEHRLRRRLRRGAGVHRSAGERAAVQQRAVRCAGAVRLRQGHAGAGCDAARDDQRPGALVVVLVGRPAEVRRHVDAPGVRR